MTENELAWFVGLFEGEGCISFYGKKLRLIISMTDKDIITRVHSLAGGTLHGPYTRKDRPKDKPIWRWTLYKRDVVGKLLTRMLPYLGERRQTKAVEVLHFMLGAKSVKT